LNAPVIAFTADWSARAEYFLLSQSMNTQIFDDGNGNQYFSRIRNENHILRFGLNYHFGENERIPGALEYGGHKNPSSDGDEKAKITEERYSFHAQTTTVLQAIPKFYAKYNEPKSFASGGRTTY
jgi:high affinity Mn2+ porin